MDIFSHGRSVPEVELDLSACLSVDRPEAVQHGDSKERTIGAGTTLHATRARQPCDAFLIWLPNLAVRILGFG
jgi:hypothetical protein